MNDRWIGAVATLGLAGETAGLWKWRPRASKEALDAFEQEHGVALPADYRRVLAELGNGAEGDLELFPLGHCIVDHVMVPVVQGGEPDLRVEFPWRVEPAYWNADADGSEEILGDASEVCGAIVVAANAAGGVELLVLCGPERGRMWEQDGGPPAPASNPLLCSLPYAGWLAVQMALRLGRHELLDTWRRAHREPSAP